MLSPPSNKIIIKVSVVSKGETSNISSRRKTPSKGPRIMPINMRNKESGKPVLLKSALDEKPMAIMAPMIAKIVRVSVIDLPLRN